MSTPASSRRSSIKQALVFAAVAFCSLNLAVQGAPTPQQPLPDNAQVVKLPSGEMSGMVPPVAFLPPTIDDPLPGDRTTVATPAPTTLPAPTQTRVASTATFVPTSTTVIPTPTPTSVTDSVPLPTAPQLAPASASVRSGRAQVDTVSAADAATAAAGAADGDVQAANLDLGRVIGAITGNGGQNIGRVIGAVTRGTTGIIGAVNGDLTQIPGIIGAVTDGLGAVGDIVGDLNGDGQGGEQPPEDGQGGEEEEEVVDQPAPGAGNGGRNVVDGIGRAARTIGRIGQVGQQLGLFNENDATPGAGSQDEDAVGIAVMPPAAASA